MLFCSLIGQMSANKRTLLCHVIRVLQHISRHSHVNKMTSSNLSVCLATSMLWPADEATGLPFFHWLPEAYEPRKKLSADGEEFGSTTVVKWLIDTADLVLINFNWSATVYNNFLTPVSMRRSHLPSRLDDFDAVDGMQVVLRARLIRRSTVLS